MRLTDISIRSLPIPDHGQKIHWDDVPGFGVRVSQGGTKTFVLMHGRDRQLTTIGRCGVLDLKAARNRAKELLAERTLGKTRPQTISSKAAVELFLAEKMEARRASTVASYKRRLAHFHFNDRLSAFSPDDFSKALKRIKGPSERDHALVAAKVFFSWAIKRRYITDNPTIGYPRGQHIPRSRVLTNDDLKRVWMAAEQMGGSFGTIARLLILTGQRRGEIAALQSSWISESEKTITLPATITKNRREHTFPISSLAWQTLGSTASENGWFFPARGQSNRAFSGWSKSKIALDKLCGVSEWTLHDIRRTVASNLAALGVQLPVIERLLNHVSGSFGGIVSVYQKHSFMPEMRAAIERWEAHLSSLVKSE